MYPCFEFTVTIKDDVYFDAIRCQKTILHETHTALLIVPKR